MLKGQALVSVPPRRVAACWVCVPSLPVPPTPTTHPPHPHPTHTPPTPHSTPPLPPPPPLPPRPPAQALHLHGPVSVVMNAALPAFKFYNEGVYHNDACSTVRLGSRV